MGGYGPDVGEPDVVNKSQEKKRRKRETHKGVNPQKVSFDAITVTKSPPKQAACSFPKNEQDESIFWSNQSTKRNSMIRNESTERGELINVELLTGSQYY